MQVGLYDARFEEQKVKKPKAVPIGPTVMLDAERCILCSRCVRFTDEISKTGEFGIFNRGDRAQIGLYPGKVLANDYSGNVVDICPVGALTDRDFRFKCRVWYLSTSPSVCPGCAEGCNIDIHYVLNRPHLAGGARVMRLKPRYNPEVNRWWMCDEGRYGYKSIDEGRLRKVLRRGVEVTWETAFKALGEYLGRVKRENLQEGVGVIPSAQLTNEELFMVGKLFKEGLGILKCDARVPTPPGYSDDFLIKADKNPNTAGAALLGLAGDGSCSVTQMVEQALAGRIRVLWVFGHDLVKLFTEEKVKRLAEGLELFVFQGSHENGTSRYAHWVLPSAVYAEKDGTFVNCHGRIQRIVKAFDPLKGSQADWQILLRLFEPLQIPIAYRSPEEILAAIGKEVPAFSGVTYEKVGLQGTPLPMGVSASSPVHLSIPP
jgi:NADH-quinone oxidoreductase subunit G